MNKFDKPIATCKRYPLDLWIVRKNWSDDATFVASSCSGLVAWTVSRCPVRLPPRPSRMDLHMSVEKINTLWKGFATCLIKIITLRRKKRYVL